MGFSWRIKLARLGRHSNYLTAIGILVGVVSLLAPTFQRPNLARIGGSLLLAGISVVPILYSKYIFSTVEITCIPEGELHTAREHHNSQFYMDKDYKTFDTFVDVTGVRNRITVNIEISDRLNNAASDYPDDVNFQEGHEQFSYSGEDDFSFNLELNGDKTAIQGGECTVKFIDDDTDRTIGQITLEPIS